MRKEIKTKAKKRVKKCYWLFVVLCLVSAMLGLDHSGSLSVIKTDINSGVDNIQLTERFGEVFEQIATGDENEAEAVTDEAVQAKRKESAKVGIIALDHSRGIAAQLVNNVSTGRIVVTLYQSITSMVKSKSVGRAIFIALALFVTAFCFIFIFNVLRVVLKRFFMESRLYDHIPMNRFFFFIEVKRWWSVAKTMLLMTLYQALWSLTIIGGFIKGFSYQMVPYIIAENPSMGAKEAITLSRKMMKGHKWEAFVLYLSFIPWDLLGMVTWGLTEIFYSNPYKEATLAEYYNYIRTVSKENNITNVEKLNDRYLYEYADEAVLSEEYSDYEPQVFEQEAPKRKGFLGLLENTIGLTLVYDAQEREYERIKANQYRMKGIRMIMNHKMYPRRLFSISGGDKVKNISSLHFDRHYSIISIILLFFAVCMIGWGWEVTLHLIKDGKFVNRGVLHGPWLPIYGAGGAMILMVLNKFRRYPAVEFITAIVLCGCVEYFASYFLEVTHNGTKWWDYTGYFLNLNGRICMEGLLVFGLGGMAIVYILAPFLDNMFRHIPIKVAIAVSAMLVVSFVGDQIYSAKYPNIGEGITDYDKVVAQEMSSAEDGTEIQEMIVNV